MHWRKRQIEEDEDAVNQLPYHPLFDYLMDRLNIEFDKDLANYFGIAGSTLSKVRRGTANVSAEMILIIHEKLDIPVADIRKLIDEGKK
jgi:transcriptional regulator with XRE-family HTH domain